jgi:hypothetical protein
MMMGHEQSSIRVMMTAALCCCIPSCLLRWRGRWVSAVVVLLLVLLLISWGQNRFERNFVHLPLLVPSIFHTGFFCNGSLVAYVNHVQKNLAGCDTDVACHIPSLYSTSLSCVHSSCLAAEHAFTTAACVGTYQNQAYDM